MVLLPLEFRDCLTDSPQFRENLACHEKELETTSQSMKSILKEIKELLSAARSKYAGSARVRMLEAAHCYCSVDDNFLEAFFHICSCVYVRMCVCRIQRRAPAERNAGVEIRRHIDSP